MPGAIERHAIGAIGVWHDHREPLPLEREARPVERQALDRHKWAPRGPRVGRREAGEVQRVLGGDVDGTLVRVDVDHPLEAGSGPERRRELVGHAREAGRRRAANGRGDDGG
jgi:hypothetical protein